MIARKCRCRRATAWNGPASSARWWKREAACRHRAAEPAVDHDAALRPVQFDSRHLLALSGIPFAVAGGILGLYVAGLNFGISAIGFISLFGVSAMDGILLVSTSART